MPGADSFTLTETGPGRYALAGSVSLDNAVDVLERGEQVFAGLVEATVDLAGVTHMDGGGFAVLLEWLRGARQGRRALRFTSPPAQLRAIARLCDTEDLLLSPHPPD